MFMQNTGQQHNDFPPVTQATEEGLLAIGGDLSAERLLSAYSQGIFPWYNAGQPILWWSPDPRCVLFPQKYKIPRSLKKSIRAKDFSFTMDRNFTQVIDQCAAPRENEPGTWITDEMKAAYCHLHNLGFAHSIETWQSGKLAGGLYGIALGGVFFGESMFSHVSDASKGALAFLVAQLKNWEFTLIDCQVTSPHLLSLGAEEIARANFMKQLEFALRLDGKPGHWRQEDTIPIVRSP